MVDTGFDATANGFRFTNRFGGGAVVAELARQERLDELVGVNVPAVFSSLLGLVRDASFWGPFGLCGGMAWAALDRFDSGEDPPPDTVPPDPSSALFTELVSRQADSLDGQRVLWRCLEWQILPDRPPWWWPWLKNVGRETARVEWPLLKASLDAGRPQSLCLLRVKGLVSPGQNHQVVASGYDMVGADQVVIRIYDPNHPGDTPELRMRIGGLMSPLEITQTSGENLRGFFVQEWNPA